MVNVISSFFVYFNGNFNKILIVHEKFEYLFLKVGDYNMAYFFHSEINAIAKCESYDHLTSLVAYGICRNTVTQLVPNIIEAIDRLDINSDFNYFIDCMSNIYTGYVYTEAFNSILRHFANKVATNIDSITFEPNELSILIVFMFADDKSFYNKMTSGLKEKLYAGIFKYLNQPYAYRAFKSINPDSIEKVFNYFDEKISSIINNQIYSINEVESDVGKRMHIQALMPEGSYIPTWLFTSVVKIVQNFDIEYHMKNIARTLWNEKKDKTEDFIKSKVISIFKIPINNDNERRIECIISLAFSWINGFNRELSPLLPAGYIYDHKNIYADMAKYPVIGKYIYSFIEDIYNHRTIIGPDFGIAKLDEVIYTIYNMCAHAYYALKTETANTSIMGYIECIINDYSLEIKEDIFMTEKYKNILEKFRNTDEGTSLAWDFAVASEAASEDDDYDYTGPEIEATQSKKGYKKASKVQSDSERKIYKAYSKYKNAESKVDSQLSKMLTSAKKAFSQDKTEEIIEGKKFTPIGLLKKILTTSAIFSYSKIAGFLYLLVGHTLSKKRTNKQREDIIIQMNEEIKLLDEKIEDARGDGNRKAKYALMRTRGEIVRARDKIKYGLRATKEDMKVAKNYISADRRDKDNI